MNYKSYAETLIENEDKYFNAMEDTKYEIEKHLGYKLDRVDMEKDDVITLIIKKIDGSVYRLYDWDEKPESAANFIKEIDEDE